MGVFDASLCTGIFHISMIILILLGIIRFKHAINYSNFLKTASKNNSRIILDKSDAEQLLGQGVDPNLTEDGDGITALHLAAQEKDLGIVKALLVAGGDPHAESVDGHTPIDIAELANHIEMANIMREFKSSVN